MRHNTQLLRAAVTASLMLVAIAGAVTRDADHHAG